MIIIFVEFINQLIDYLINCASLSCKFDFQLGHLTFVEIDHEVLSTVILPLPGIQVGSCQLLGKVCVIVNFLED